MSKEFDAFQRDVRNLLENVRQRSGEVAPNEILFNSTVKGKLPPAGKKDIKLSISLGFPKNPAPHPDAEFLKDELNALLASHAVSLQNVHGLTLTLSQPTFSSGSGLIRLTLPRNHEGSENQRRATFEHMRKFELMVEPFATPSHFTFVPRRRPV